MAKTIEEIRQYDRDSKREKRKRDPEWHRDYMRKWNANLKANNPEKYKEHLENNRESYKRNYHKYRISVALRSRKRNETNRIKCLEVYSGGDINCCFPGCNISDVDMLTLDHINGGGINDRKEHGGDFTAYLVKSNFPAGMQVLCANHNHKKEMERRRSNRISLPPWSLEGK